MVMDAGLGVAGAQGRGLAHGGNAGAFDSDGTLRDDARSGETLGKRIALKADHLPQKKFGHSKTPILAAPA